jgi:hypothetical protein
MQHKIVSQYAQLWPRDVFNIRDGDRFDRDLKTALSGAGVYVLYREDNPYYIGQASKALFKRLRAHAVLPTDKYYNFWSHFSAYLVPDVDHLDEVEGILIAAMPLAANRARPHFERLNLPPSVSDKLTQRNWISPKAIQNNK